jgi:signal transduction histidine kinase/CheY-like chemotaxis protein
MRSGRAVHGVEHAIETPDGRRRILRINAAPLKDRDGEIERVVCSFEDVTERRAIEEALRQSQKMEAIGRLAGGVAHDFNNLLTAILSFAAIARQRLRAGDHGGPAHGGIDDDLDAITEAGERAAGLTRQLLAFGRKDVRRPIVLDAGARVVQAARLLSRIVGEHVTVRTAVGPAPVYVRIDEGHLQQVLVNLAVNARDAMPRGGLLVLAVEGIDVEDDAPGRPAGAYVRIRVTDNGTGMDDATRARAIEPFFTTKALNEGTGLGLSTCHAIVVQAGGTLAIESAVGRGTTVLIDLPAVAAPEAEAQVTAGRAPASRGREQILVVEDDPAVRTVATRSLRAAGYDVLAAASGEQAREIVASVGRLDLVVCDIVLPGRSGFDVVAALRETRPGLPALFVSGYSAELPRTGDEPFLAKPYTPDLLTARVRAVLDARAAAQGG